ncbi:MAG: type I restriction-modification system subunit M N-terminal domain-containing protein [Actinomycetota bacterium]
MAGTDSNGDLLSARELFEAADRMRGSVESAEYKHLVLGLLFLKYISDSSNGGEHGWRPRPATREARTTSPRPSASEQPSSKTAMSTSPRTSSGCRRRRGGTPSSLRRPSQTSERGSTRPWIRSSGTMPNPWRPPQDLRSGAHSARQARLLGGVDCRDWVRGRLRSSP